MGYAPLDFFKDGVGDIPDNMKHREGHIWEDVYPVVLQSALGVKEEEARQMTESEYLCYVLRRKFLIKGHNAEKKHAAWDENVRMFIPPMMETLNYSIKDFSDPRSLNVISELRDTLVEFVILDKWVQNKQVLKPDPTFAKYLCETEKLQVMEDTFDKLPFNTFYLDLEDCNKDNQYGDALGIFVNVQPIPYDRETAVTLYILRPGNIIVSLYLNFDMKNCPHDIDTGGIEESRNIQTVPVVVEKEKAPASTQINPRLMTILVLQLISYMKAAKPDIEPSPEMKNTYRPRAEIKNRYSEVYKQDVGIRIGKAITDKIKKMNEAKEKEERDAVSTGRKPPVPHFRKAHWHRYWTGKGRTVCELRWIEPVFVCGSYSSDSKTDVIIHNMK